MYNRSDPRFRRTINQISSNLETANETAQIGLFSFTENYVRPCLGVTGQCLQQTAGTCFPRHEDRARRQRSRARGRPELSFDFYDDWEADETDALISPQNDELERLLGPSEELEPSSRDPINYGTQPAIGVVKARRKGGALGQPNTRDPTVIPNQSYFGFMHKLPNLFGGRILRYQPSAADLQERPRPAPKQGEVAVLPTETSGTEQNVAERRHKRQRSDTVRSGQTEESLSSRGDIFPSDDEDDAVALDDEFAVALERRNKSGHDDSSSGKTGSSQRPPTSSRSHSSKSPPESINSQTRNTGGSVDYEVEEGRIPVSSVKKEHDVGIPVAVEIPQASKLDTSLHSSEEPLDDRHHKPH